MNKNVVNCDEKLKSILLGKQRVELVDLPSLIKLHFTKTPKSNWRTLDSLFVFISVMEYIERYDTCSNSWIIFEMQVVSQRFFFLDQIPFLYYFVNGCSLPGSDLTSFITSKYHLKYFHKHIVIKMVLLQHFGSLVKIRPSNLTDHWYKLQICKNNT